MRQQDSHEFIRLYLEAFDEEQLPSRSSSLPLKDPTPAEHKPRWMEQIFGGKILSSVKCLHCSFVSTIEEPFMDLSLALLPPKDDGAGLLYSLKNRYLPTFLNSARIALEDLLEQFVRIDNFNDDFVYDCEKCSRLELVDSDSSSSSDARDVAYRQANKWERVAEFPNILVIHLNRFNADGSLFSKNSTSVNYHEYLVMDKYSVDANPKGDILASPKTDIVQYELYATIVHSGLSANSGHYTAMIRCASTNSWFYCSDSIVRPTTLAQALAGDAYLLFYQRT